MFANYGQGSIWSSTAEFSISRITTILDRASFTLEDLLQEDDLLQEIKANNEKLIKFLSESDQVQTMLAYVIEETTSTDSDVIRFKYPFMSCEVICCEVNSILDTLVTWNDQLLLHKLFSMLSTDGQIDRYSAGYFEKILEILFRKRTSQVMTFINLQGQDLLNNFLHHIDNYSIMQIVQRLMLPHIPFVVDMIDDGSVASIAAVPPPACSWSFLPNVCSTLIEKMTKPDTGQGSFTIFHISELLITVVQLSPPDTLFVSHMCIKENLDRLFTGAFQLDKSDACDDEKVIYPTLNSTAGLNESDTSRNGSVLNDLSHIHITHDGEDYSRKSLSLACVAVLESLISRMSEALTPYDAASGVPEPQIDRVQVNESAASICYCVYAFLPKLSLMLRESLNSCQQGQIQTKRSCNKLGHCGLQLVKLVEAIVRLNMIHLDEGLISEGIIRLCLQIFFGFELNSLLHLAIHRIVLLSIEGQAERRLLQRHIIVECEVLQQILTTMENKERMTDMLAGGRRPLIGHLIVMSQAVVGLCNMEIDAESQMDGFSMELAAKEAETFRDIVASSPVINEWNAYVSGELAEINSLQTTSLGTIDSAEDAQMMMLMMGAGMSGGNVFTSAPFGTNNATASTDATSSDASQGVFGGSNYRSFGMNSGTTETGAESADFADFSSAFHQDNNANLFKGTDSDSDDSSSGEENVGNSDSDDEAAGNEFDGQGLVSDNTHHKHHRHENYVLDNSGLNYMIGSGSADEYDHSGAAVVVGEANKAGRKHHRQVASDGFDAPSLVSFQVSATGSSEFANFDPFGTGGEAQFQNVSVDPLPAVEDLTLHEVQDVNHIDDDDDDGSQQQQQVVASNVGTNDEQEEIIA